MDYHVKKSSDIIIPVIVFLVELFFAQLAPVSNCPLTVAYLSVCPRAIGSACKFR